MEKNVLLITAYKVLGVLEESFVKECSIGHYFSNARFDTYGLCGVVEQVSRYRFEKMALIKAFREFKGLELSESVGFWWPLDKNTLEVRKQFVKDFIKHLEDGQK